MKNQDRVLRRLPCPAGAVTLAAEWSRLMSRRLWWGKLLERGLQPRCKAGYNGKNMEEAPAVATPGRWPGTF
jgi:hypothetical protein